jgi:ethanolamine utilization microcompartment shell protein EutS
MLAFLGPASAQIIPARNCMSNPMMDGCPMAEEARKTQEMLNKPKWWEEHPELLNPKLPGSPNAPASTTRPTTPGKPNPVADTDWKRPRLAKALAADWPRWTFAPADADALVGMKLAAVAQSPVLSALPGADAGKQWRTSAPLEEVWVSIRPLPGQKTEAVMLLMGSAVESIATDLRSKGVTVCFLDKRTLLTGEWSAVNQALARVIAATPGPMAKRAGELWSSNDLWLIARRQMVNQLLPPNADTSGLTGASLGLNFQNKVAIDLLLTAATPVETARWATKLSQNPGDLGLGDVTVEKTVRGVSVRASLDPAQVPEALMRQITDQIRPVLNIAGPPQASAATSSGAIVIEGLDEGPKTIPVQKP